MKHGKYYEIYDNIERYINYSKTYFEKHELGCWSASLSKVENAIKVYKGAILLNMSRRELSPIEENLRAIMPYNLRKVMVGKQSPCNLYSYMRNDKSIYFYCPTIELLYRLDIDCQPTSALLSNIINKRKFDLFSPGFIALHPATYYHAQDVQSAFKNIIINFLKPMPISLRDIQLCMQYIKSMEEWTFIIKQVDIILKE